jgi:chemotaxis protein CheC
MIPGLSELQCDTLVEIFNIGVGRAANSLNQIISQEIMLSVPRIDLLQGSQIETVNSLIRSPRICAVSQDFTGIIEARTLLVFPEGKTMGIVRGMLGETVDIGELGEMEQEALSEIGNIILNACIGAISEVLHAEFHCSAPAYHSGLNSEILASNSLLDGEITMILHIDFSIPSDQIDGHLFFFMTLFSFNALIKQIDQLLQNMA